LKQQKAAVPRDSCHSGFYNSSHNERKSDKQHQQTGHSGHRHIWSAGLSFSPGNPAITQVPAKFREAQIDDTKCHEYKKEGSHTRSSFLIYMTGLKLTFTSCEKENKQNNNNDD
jgi:hypothetical protein